MKKCMLCPRGCAIDRTNGELGFCLQGSEMRVARSGLHFFEEPCISGKHGSGTVFFSGCSLRCVFCQNRDISRSENLGKTVTVDQLCEIMLSLESEGAHNINLVTPTHFADKIAEALAKVKDALAFPCFTIPRDMRELRRSGDLRGLLISICPISSIIRRSLGESIPRRPTIAREPPRRFSRCTDRSGNIGLTAREC